MLQLGYMYAVIIIVLMFLGSIIVWAEEAEPNDRLYHPVKIAVTERTGQWVGQFSETINIQWEIQLAERRLREVQNLILEGDVTPLFLADLSERYTTHADRVVSLLLREEEQKDPLFAAELALFAEARMSAFEEVLRVLAPTLDSQPQKQLLVLIEDIAAQRARLEEIQTRVEGRSGTFANIERAARDRARGARTEADISERRFDQRRFRLSESEEGYLQTELDAMKDAIRNGRNLLEKKEFSDAFLKFQEADRYAQRIEIFADAARVIKLR